MAGVSVDIDTDLCDNTLACEAVCPDDVFQLLEGRVIVVAASRCSLCFKCMESCTSGAVTIDF